MKAARSCLAGELYAKKCTGLIGIAMSIVLVQAAAAMIANIDAQCERAVRHFVCALHKRLDGEDGSRANENRQSRKLGFDPDGEWRLYSWGWQGELI